MRRILLSCLLLLPFNVQAARVPQHNFILPENPSAASDARPAEEIAREHLRNIAEDIGLPVADLKSVYIAKQYKTSHNGVTHLLLRQRYSGFEVSGAAWNINIDAKGHVLNSGGRLYPAPEEPGMASSSGAGKALRSAVSSINHKAAAGFQVIPNGAPLRSTHGYRFARGPLVEDPEGTQVWVESEGKLRSGWCFEVTNTSGPDRFLISVADANQQVTQKTPLVFYQKAPAGTVFERQTPQPYSYGTRITTAPPYVDRTLQSFAGDPVASPRGWVSGNETAGNNVVAGENLGGRAFLFTPDTAKATNGIFDFPLQLGIGAPNPVTFGNAATTNLFYWMNRAHDLHYLYGFDEQAGNFQADNFGKGGLGGDPLYVYSHFGSQTIGGAQVLNAYFSARNSQLDGDAAMVAMFVSAGRSQSDVMNSFSDGSLDAYVMLHEYTHGVSTRLVSGAYQEFQGASMGEAWSDFFGIEYTLPPNSPPDGIYPAGEYFTQSWGVGDGRTRPYTTDMSLNSLTYADAGKVTQYPEVHADGEIWFEALWEARSNLIKQFGDQEGRRRIRLLVMDGMKLSVPSPSMVDARDAILLADRIDFKGASQSQLWAAFAKRGLGALAYSDGGDTVHVSASTDLPSTKGSLKFYDNPLIVGDQLRIIAQDANYSAPTMLVQVTASSGDVENVILKRHGSVYYGTIYSASTNVNIQNGTLNIIPGDEVSAYYVDYDTGSGSELTSITMETLRPYSAFYDFTPPVSSFPGEVKLSLSSLTTYVGEVSRTQLPFTFPFYAKKYDSVTVQPNGILSFEHLRGESTGCTDARSLASSAAIAPLWMNLIVDGNAQKNEGVYVSSTPKSFTVRWAAETYAYYTTGTPVNFAVTLYDDGRILMQYLSNPSFLGDAYVFPGCGAAPVIGTAPGNDLYSYAYQSDVLLGYGLRFDPPYNFSSIPTVTLLTPTAGANVQGILSVTGAVADTSANVSRVDVIIDGIQRAQATLSQFSFSATLDINALGLKPGPHTIKVRATNSRGAFADYPVGTPLTFSVNPGQSAVPTVVIETPSEGSSIAGTLQVSGYALIESLSISRMDILIDGLSRSGLTYNLSRADVCTALKSASPNCPRVGFSASLTTSNAIPPIPDGQHGLQVRVIDTTGRITVYPEKPVTINVNNGAAVPTTASLTSPAPNDHVSGKVTFSGFGYADGSHKITNVYVLVDGQFIVPGTYGLASPDVCSKLQNVPACPNIGYSVTYDTKQLLNGQHQFGIWLRNDHGDVTLVPALSSRGMTLFVEN